jgi:hypothetical protein
MVIFSDIYLLLAIVDYVMQCSHLISLDALGVLMSDIEKIAAELRAFQPSTKDMSMREQFRRIYPVILEKVGEGMSLAEILRFLKGRGLRISDAYYFQLTREFKNSKPEM